MKKLENSGSNILKSRSTTDDIIRSLKPSNFSDRVDDWGNKGWVTTYFHVMFYDGASHYLSPIFNSLPAMDCRSLDLGDVVTRATMLIKLSYWLYDWFVLDI